MAFVMNRRSKATRDEDALMKRISIGRVVQSQPEEYIKIYMYYCWVICESHCW